MISNVKTTLLVLLSLFTVTASAQKLSVEGMETLSMDTYASVHKRVDNNGTACAVVRVSLPLAGATFSGTNHMGNIERVGADYMVFMPAGSKKMYIQHPNFHELEVNFSSYGIDRLQSLVTYRVTINVPQMGMAVQQDNGMTYFILNVQPKNAQVSIDGNPLPIDANGDYSILLPRTSHTYTVSAGGYETKTETFMLGTERKRVDVSLVSNMASLTINAATAGTQIYVNEQNRGTTRWTGQVLPGNYVIEGRLDGYYPHKQTITIANRQQQTISIPALVARTGSLDVSYKPSDSEVWIDGKKVGMSPDIFNGILIGSHKVSIRKDGYATKDVTVNITEGQTTSLTGALEQNAVSATISGNAKELYDKGKEYYNKKNYTEAVKYYMQAAEQGDARAQCDLGYCYNNGLGVVQNHIQAVLWYRKSAEQGNKYAQCNLGYCYEKGQGVTQDYSQAVSWYRKSAEQGYAGAQCNLGSCYYNGNGVSQDYSQAVYWYRKSAEQGDATAQSNLGSCYYDGNGVTQDYSQAVYWYRKSADQGHANGQSWLGYCYQYGIGVDKDLSMAKYWYKKAADQGDDYSKKKLEELGN